MESKKFTSVAVSRGAYEPTTNVLTLWFTTNPQAPYTYRGVPASIWAGLIAASSKSRYYSEHIQNAYTSRQ